MIYKHFGLALQEKREFINKATKLREIEKRWPDFYSNFFYLPVFQKILPDELDNALNRSDSISLLSSHLLEAGVIVPF